MLIINLNIQDQLDSIVNMLIKKMQPSERLDFITERFKNLEAIALSYIFVAILVVFLYEPNIDEDKDTFKLEDWIKQIEQVTKNSLGMN